MTALESMRLGSSGPTISRLGMGCWAIGGHGWGHVSEEDSICAIRCALEHGVTFFDTADAYGLGKSETLLADVLGSSRKDVVIASKGGVRWNESGKVWTDTSPAYLRQAAENSLKRLKLDCIPLYYIHKPDDITPVQESMAALERMLEQGKIGAIGVSNFSRDQLLQALQVAPITAVQSRFNLFDGNDSLELLDICRKHGIKFVAWGVLADGLLTGKFKKETKFSDDDHRSKMSEFSGKTFLKHAKCIQLLEQSAASMGKKVSHIALRWVLDVAPFTSSLFGAKTATQVMENLGADGWRLTKENLAVIDFIMEEFRN